MVMADIDGDIEERMLGNVGLVQVKLLLQSHFIPGYNLKT